MTGTTGTLSPYKLGQLAFWLAAFGTEQRERMVAADIAAGTYTVADGLAIVRLIESGAY
jgi:hypothetical protein